MATRRAGSSARRALALDGVPVHDDELAERVVRINKGRVERGFSPVHLGSVLTVDEARAHLDMPKLDDTGVMRVTFALDAKPMQDAIRRVSEDLERRVADAMAAEIDAMLFHDSHR